MSPEKKNERSIEPFSDSMGGRGVAFARKSELKQTLKTWGARCRFLFTITRQPSWESTAASVYGHMHESQKGFPSNSWGVHSPSSDERLSDRDIPETNCFERFVTRGRPWSFGLWLESK